MAPRKRPPDATAPDGAILVINSGSSSVKFALFSGPGQQLCRLWSGAIERIGLPNGRFHIVDAKHLTLRDDSKDIADHQAALGLLLDAIEADHPRPLEAVGHRIVHGGPDCDCPLVVTLAVEKRLRELIPLAPLHQPHNLAGIAAVRIESADVVLVRSDPRDVFAILALSRATYGKMIQNLLWATGYNTFAIPLAAGVGYAWGLLLSPAMGAALMSLSTVIVAINAKLLERARNLVARAARVVPEARNHVEGEPAGIRGGAAVDAYQGRLGRECGRMQVAGRSPMQAQDIMTRDVATVSPESSVHDIAALMVRKHISGVPVLTDDGKIIGMVSQSDLLHRAEVGTERKHKWWFRIFADSDALAREFTKAHGLKARDIMSRYVISVRDDVELRDVADILDHQRIKRVPVVREGRLVGIIARSDLVRALSQVQPSKAARKIDDAALHRSLRDRIRTLSWINDSYINLTVSGGVVELWGLVVSTDQRNALRALVEETDGVNRVDDRLSLAGPLRGGA